MIARPEAGARCAEARPIDWRHAAELLAYGLSMTAVARRVGCSRSQLSRRRSQPAFRRWIEEAPATTAGRERERIGELRTALHTAIEAEVKAGTVRVILWLADRLNLITPPSERTPEQELRTILSGLGPEELREFESLRDTP